MNVTNLLKFQFHQMMRSFLEGRFLLAVVALVPIDSGRNFGRSQVYYVAHTSFPSPAPSWTINFGLSVNMLAWTLK